ncbi:hypothetical protein [Archangium lipolyticum]|uniref:hypothetical protein n=1 Tax=Archangium lipolyticum TaxID=2970465 RepID=UPI002149C0CE|nr:hypothetical protein [Archangium lipolyticum]
MPRRPYVGCMARIELNKLELAHLLAALKMYEERCEAGDGDATDKVHVIQPLRNHLQTIHDEGTPEELISAPLTRHLHVIAKQMIDDMDEANRLYESGQEEGNDWVDPNDYFIWQGFILSVLEENLDSGFQRDEMLDKGYGFLMGCIPAYLKQEQELETSLRGGLMRLYVHWTLEWVMNHASFLSDANWPANLPSVQQHLRRVLELA